MSLVTVFTQVWGQPEALNTSVCPTIILKKSHLYSLNFLGSVKMGRGHHSHLWVMIILKPIFSLVDLNVESGAQTSLHGIEHLNGCYVSRCKVKDMDPKARDDAIAKKLWEVNESCCLALTGTHWRCPDV